MKTIKHFRNFLPLILLNGSVIAQNNNVAENVPQVVSTTNYNTTGWALIILLLIQILVVKAISDAIKNVSKSDAIQKNNNRGLSTLIFLIGLIFSINAFGQNTSANNSLIDFSETEINILITLNILLSLVVLWMYYQFRQILKFTNLIKEEDASSAFWNIEHWLTRSVPVEKEASIQFEHEYDGIRELDNVLPPWWLWMFYATIVFSFIYLIHYHISPIKALEKIGFVGPGVGQEELYKMEMEEAEKQKQAYLAQAASKINEENVTLLTDANELAKGKEIFTTNCVVCHGNQGQGGAGPNLTDEYWIHGCDIKNVFKTIKYGVPAKGMIAWESQLSPLQIQQVASFVISLKGTNPSGAKEPQGEKCDNNATATPAVKDSTASK